MTDLLNRHGDGTTVATSVTLTIGSFLSHFVALMRADILVRVGFRPGVNSLRGIFYDILWLLVVFLNSRAREVYYWIGSDVLRSVEDYSGKKNIVNQFFFRKAKIHAKHFAAAPWLVGELEAIGVTAHSVLFPSPLTCLSTAPEMPTKFSVLSYIPDQRHVFYGGEMLLQVAKTLPDIDFHIVAGEGAWVVNPPPNVHFHGWVRDMSSMYISSSVVVRLVQHDALGGTVREGLAFARHVIYSYPLPHVVHVDYGDVQALHGALLGFFSKHAALELSPNIVGMRFAKENFSEGKLTLNLIKELAEL